MNIIIPLAGRDPRFAGSFKAFMDADGMPLIKRIVGGLHPAPTDRFIFIVLEEDDKKFGVSEKLSELFGKNIIVRYLRVVTRGSPESILVATKDLINNDTGLLIELGDVLRETEPLFKDIAVMEPGVSGIIPVEKKDMSPRLWGYVKMDAKGNSEALLEKEPTYIAPWATMGLYYFSRGKDFVWAAEEMMHKKSYVYKDMFFVGPAYNELIGRGDRVIISDNTLIAVLGSPEEIKGFSTKK
jgi:UDP-N-acetylglucosamine diphosphorylase / glucose-1-phosphate thymidylyltransferase / UDP-N-acetylgalactosamine diphosphorylase / glucosamine-1-phosphate N-acetyltransferase / galactosamine-1-phosphate N-acetyltransferase